jgi:multiple sugar transport system permease protein
MSGPRNREWLWGPLYALPALALVLAFIGYPFGSIIYHSLTRWDGISPPQGIGFHNYHVLLHDHIFRLALRNNLLFATSVPVQLVVPLLLAYAIYLRLPGWRLFRSSFFLPAVYSTVVVGIIAQVILLLGGPLNTTLNAVGLGVLRRDWLASSTTSIPMILVVLIWANFGYNVLIYLAGMSAIDPEMIEAAKLDGASPLRVLRHVIVPNLRRVMELILVINTITAFAYMFTYIYVMTNGGPGFETYVTELLIYNHAFTFQNLGYASAIGVTLTALIAILGYFQIRMITGGRAGAASR